MYTRVLDFAGTISATVIRRDADGALIPADPGNVDWQAYESWCEAGNAPADPSMPPAVAPDGPTLSDWRVALTLWGRIDDVTSRVNALAGSSDRSKAMLGRIAKERLEYANTVLRVQLVALKDALGFSVADIDESLWRAAQVAKGDLSGVWPPKDG